MPEATALLRNGEVLPDEDPARSYLLPARFYTDPEVFEREKSAILFRGWHYLGHASQVSAPGDYITGRIVDQSVFVIRGKDGALHAFYNVCQHRAHELLRGAGSVKVITCPYHAWSYHADGRLRAARNCEAVAGFEKDEIRLQPVAVEDFCGFVFVNLEVDAQPLATLVPDLADDLQGLIPSLAEQRPVRAMSLFDVDIEAGWKVVVDNFLECYHCRNAHPALADMIDMDAYQSASFGLWSRQFGPEVKLQNTAYDLAADAPVPYSAFWYLWPTTAFILNPGKAQIDVASMMPTGLETTAFTGHHYAMPGDALDEARITYMNEILGPEDTRLCESVQLGLKSRSYRQGRVMVDSQGCGTLEQAVHHFHRLVLGALEG